MSDKLKGIFSCILGASFWGVSGICGQFFFANYPISAAQVTVIRMLGTAVVLLPFLRWQQGPKIYDIFSNKRDVVILLLFSLFGLLFCQYAYIAAIYYSNAPTATILQYTSAIFILVFTCLRFLRLPTIREALSIMMAVGGVFLIVTHGDISTLVLSNSGLFWGINAALGAAFYILIPTRIIHKYGVLTIISYAMLIGGVALWLLGRVDIFNLNLDLAGYAMILVIILVGTLGGFGLYLHGSSLVGSIGAGMLGAFEPLTSLVLSVIIFEMVFAPVDYAGFVLVLVAILVLAGKKRKS